MMQYGFKNFAEDVLNTVQKPLSIMEIWEEGIRLGLNKKLGSSGKTPWATLGARLYTDIKLNDQSNFKQISRRPALFALKSQIFAVSEVNKRQLESETVPVKCSYEERALHAVLAKYLETSSYFMCPVKTVYHEKSKKGKLHQDKWTYPDLIGIYFPFEDYEALTLKTLKLFNEQPYKVFSFEMKQKLDLGNLRSEYFQAVSNSSWANEGYLVAPIITTENEDFMSELTLLNNSFGIGVIKLNIEIPEESEILFRSKLKQHLDINMLDKLILKNKDVASLFQCVLESQSLEKIVDKEKIFDPVLDDNAYQKYLKDKKLRL
ncbi:MAG: HTH domain-containing protein [Coriobacteriales bacterium]|jgi:conserved hypothetical protein|nr:MAG: HrgA protein [Clostridiales bacterium]